jgi:phosphoribosylformylglycinamidine synthase subunit PurS
MPRAQISIPKLARPANRRGKVPKIIVEIMPKQDLLDPQGKAVANALHRSGHPEIVNARIGKRIELHFEREITEADMATAEELASSFLSNDVIEDVVSITKE